MKVEDYRDKTIFDSDGHGKACKGDKKTTGMQVRDYIGSGYLLLKTVNYKIGDIDARNNAIKKCRAYIDEDFE